MRCAVSGFIFLLGTSSAALTQTAGNEDPPASPWSVSYNQEVRYSSWSGDRGTPGSIAVMPGKGSQLYLPFGISLNGALNEDTKLQLGVSGGWVRSSQQTAGFAGQVATQTDTVFSGTMTYNGFDGYQPFVALSVNTPTGKAILKGNAAYARMDSDLVEVGSFGGGITIGPSVGVNIPLNPAFTLSFGAGLTVPIKFNVEGVFDSNNVQGLTEVSPGRNTTVNASLGYQMGSVYLLVSTAYSVSGTTFINGTASYLPGASWSISGSGSYAWTPTSTTSVTASWSLSQKNQVYDAGLEKLVYDERNANNPYYRARIEHTFDFDAWSVGPFVNWMRRNVNTYDPIHYLFTPPKTRWGLGAAVKYKVSDKVVLNASIERIWVHEYENPDKPFFGVVAVPALNYTGLSMVIGGTVQF